MTGSGPAAVLHALTPLFTATLPLVHMQCPWVQTGLFDPTTAPTRPWPTPPTVHKHIYTVPTTLSHLLAILRPDLQTLVT